MEKFNAEIRRNFRGLYNIYIDWHGDKLIMSEKHKILEFDNIEKATEYLEDKKRIILTEVIA